ncbi:MAG: hypothetical protein LWW83_09865 [Azonexaceae bacterium]|uniref:hypothetical protein n=1 Tax=Azonexus sp. R2A61 TaxID=2744443 RepID=UPI001F3AED1E|nr:hypothetical protein [Azonexus sp. R2A61]MCE1240212.1 hypothetical protein [Azonexaceae bacterium]
MLLDRYEHLFFNANFSEVFSGAVAAYRGELIVKEGEITDEQGRRKPPVEVMKQAIVLADGDKLKFISGSLDEFQYFHGFMDKFGADITADTLVILFVVNIDNPFIADVNGAKAVFIPLVQGMTWNELGDLAALEKGDFKGQGAAEKVVTMYDALKGNKYKYPESTVELELTKTNSNKRVNHGAV